MATMNDVLSPFLYDTKGHHCVLEVPEHPEGCLGDVLSSDSDLVVTAAQVQLAVDGGAVEGGQALQE